MSQEKKELEITSERTLVANTPGVEPEAQEVKRQFGTPVSMGPRGGTTTGGVPGVIEYSTTAGAMANAVRGACAGCRHFDVKLWNKYLAAAEAPMAKEESKQTMQAMRVRVLRAGYGFQDKFGRVDIEATMKAHGICRVLSEWVKGAVGEDPVHWPVICWREAVCPTYVAAGPHRMDVVTDAQPLGLFVPVDREAIGIGDKRYDAVMFDASGKLK